jgi:transposase
MVMASVFWGCAWYYINRLPRKGPNHQQRLLHSVIGAMKSRKTAPFEEKKVLFHQNNTPVHKSIRTTAKLHELGYELLHHPPYSPDLAPSDFFLFADLKRMLAEKKFSTYEELLKMRPILRLCRNRTVKMVSKNCMTAIIVVSPSKAS